MVYKPLLPKPVLAAWICAAGLGPGGGKDIAKTLAPWITPLPKANLYILPTHFAPPHPIRSSVPVADTILPGSTLASPDTSFPSQHHPWHAPPQHTTLHFGVVRVQGQAGGPNNAHFRTCGGYGRLVAKKQLQLCCSSSPCDLPCPPHCMSLLIPPRPILTFLLIYLLWLVAGEALEWAGSSAF